MTRYFTADLHLGHKNIIRYCNRPFRDVEHMDDSLISQWVATAGPGDEVFHLGDLSLSYGETMLAYLRRLTGRVHLIPGNHDQDGLRKLARDGLIPDHVTLYPYGPGVEVDIGGQRTVLTHLPPKGAYINSRSMEPYRDERYEKKRIELVEGAWHLHGHVHGNAPKGEPMLLDVGWDAHKRLVAEKDLAEMISAA